MDGNKINTNGRTVCRIMTIPTTTSLWTWNIRMPFIHTAMILLELNSLLQAGLSQQDCGEITLHCGNDVSISLGLCVINYFVHSLKYVIIFFYYFDRYLDRILKLCCNLVFSCLEKFGKCD